MTELKLAERNARATIRTVAADAGVSVAAVSKVLRNAYGVSDSLRKKVLTSIERLGYRPSMAARGMRGQTQTIGVLLIEIANPFLPEIINGVHEVLAPSRYKAMLGIGQNNMPIESSLIESMIDYHMDGLILVAPRISDEIITRYASKIPIVVIGHHYSQASAYDTVNGNDRHGAELAVNALIETGRRDIMMVTLGIDDCNDASLIRQREIGYLGAMTHAGLANKARIVSLPETAPERDITIRDILSSPARPEAIFCWSDLHGIHVINRARMMGLNVPGDLALIGYDDSNVAALPLIGLSSINQFGARLGNAATELLLSRIAGRTKAVHTVLEPVLVRRSSI